MNPDESFDNLSYLDQVQLAERELASFIAAVEESFGAEQARLSAEDWLDESDLMDAPPRSTGRNWRAVTVAASAKLVNRLTAARQRTSSRHANAKIRGLLPAGVRGASGRMQAL